jgi:hypothetical protein
MYSRRQGLHGRAYRRKSSASPRGAISAVSPEQRLQLRTGFRGLDGEELYFRFQRLPCPGVVGIDDNEPVTDFHDLD